MTKGMEHYKSVSGFHCVRVHYSADADKDPDTEKGRAWVENELKGIPGGISSAQWRTEYEVDWDAAGGELCFPQLEMFKSRIVVPPFEVPETWSLYGSFDYGHRSPSCFTVYGLDHDGDIWTVWEYYKSGQGFRQIAKAIRACPLFGRLNYLPIADPSIWAKTQQVDEGNELKSIAQLFFDLPQDERVVFAPGKAGGDITVAEKINGDLWNYEALKAGKTPRFRIFANCPMQIWELSKLRYADWSGSMQEQRNLKESIVDKDNHSFDTLKYFLIQFFMAPGRQEAEPMEKLKHVDPVSYNEWMSVKRMHDRESSSKGTLGDFED